jgi:hypothetical protein
MIVNTVPFLVVVCSVGSYEDWRSDAKEFKESDLGDPMEEWEGERWADVRSANVRRIVQKVGDSSRVEQQVAAGGGGGAAAAAAAGGREGGATEVAAPAAGRRTASSPSSKHNSNGGSMGD